MDVSFWPDSCFSHHFPSIFSLVFRKFDFHQHFHFWSFWMKVEICPLITVIFLKHRQSEEGFVLFFFHCHHRLCNSRLCGLCCVFLTVSCMLQPVLLAATENSFLRIMLIKAVTLLCSLRWFACGACARIRSSGT